MNVFRRRELKFLVNAQQRQYMEQVLAARMVPDSYGCSTICNLYYDTPDYRLIRHSLEKPVYKEKLRLRSYGQVGPGVDVFLEMKKKYKGVVYKRRIRVTEPEAMAFMQRRAPLPEQSQIGRELEYFRDYYAALAPRVYLCYDRMAWFDKTDPGLRVTLDRNIRYRTENLSLTAPPGGRMLLPEDMSLMEVKAQGAIPLWLASILSGQQIRKDSFSKYGRAYMELLQKSLTESRGFNYA